MQCRMPRMWQVSCEVCWNLKVEPVPYLTKLKAFCLQNGLNAESGWYEQALAALVG